MYMTTTEKLVTSFTNKELKQLIIAARMYNKTTGNNDDTLLCKLVDAFLMSNELEWQVFGEPAGQFDFLRDMLSHADGSGCEHAYAWDASKREWEHYDLRRQPQSLHDVQSLMELAQHAAAMGVK